MFRSVCLRGEGRIGIEVEEGSGFVIALEEAQELAGFQVAKGWVGTGIGLEPAHIGVEEDDGIGRGVLGFDEQPFMVGVIDPWESMVHETAEPRRMDPTGFVGLEVVKQLAALGLMRGELDVDGVDLFCRMVANLLSGQTVSGDAKSELIIPGGGETGEKVTGNEGRVMGIRSEFLLEGFGEGGALKQGADPKPIAAIRVAIWRWDWGGLGRMEGYGKGGSAMDGERFGQIDLCGTGVDGVIFEMPVPGTLLILKKLLVPILICGGLGGDKPTIGQGRWDCRVQIEEVEEMLELLLRTGGQVLIGDGKRRNASGFEEAGPLVIVVVNKPKLAG